jgi:putative endonuclease
VSARTGKDELGRIGEQHARRVLEAKGYRFVTANWHCRAGELDLVMLDGDTLVLVEVKTRRGARAGRADDAITGPKAHRLLAAGEWFVADHPEHQHRIWRIDLVAITVSPTSGAVTHNHYVNAVVEG